MSETLDPVGAGPGPDEEFTSSIPWTDTAADCVVVCCSDPRFEQQNEDFVKALGFSQPHFMQIPSGVAVFASLVAAAGFLHKGMGLLLKKAIDLTGVETVVCIGHEDCGGYKVGKFKIVQAVSQRLADKPVREIQFDHLNKAGRTISRQLGRGIDVRVYYADVVQNASGDQVKYSPVCRWSGGRRQDLASV
jgi:hypothetical protein